MHGMALDMFPGFLAEGVDAEAFGTVMNVLASPLSGVLIGFAGPLVSPGVALLNGAIAVADALQTGDASAALSNAFGIPAGMVDAFLNGANLNLDALAPMINDAGLIKDTVTISGLNIAFGGLLTPGSTDRSTYEYTDEEGNKVTIPSVGGSIFNSIGMGVKLGGLGINVKGEAVGPIGALQGLSQTVGVLLGSGWDDWDGKGNAPVPKPPLFGLQPLATGDILSDTAETAGVAKLRAALKSLAIDNIVKTLQGVETSAEETANAAPAPVTDADSSVTDSSAANAIAAANELTHTTANKTVTVSLEKPTAVPATADAAKAPAATKVDTADEAATTDETAATATESADDAWDGSEGDAQGPDPSEGAVDPACCPDGQGPAQQSGQGRQGRGEERPHRTGREQYPQVQRIRLRLKRFECRCVQLRFRSLQARQEGRGQQEQARQQEVNRASHDSGPLCGGAHCAFTHLGSPEQLGDFLPTRSPQCKSPRNPWMTGTFASGELPHWLNSGSAPACTDRRRRRRCTRPAPW
ncbi:outer membrane porin GjpA [Mycolicibacterium fortuitum]|nr:outer membrane porin GjpA [Mycolicibacterium sp. GESEQ-9]